MNVKKLYFIIVGILLIILGIVLWSYFNRDEEVINESQEIIPEEEISDEQLRNTIVSLYFINKDTGKIEIENKLIDAKILLENPYEKLINLWLSGPTSEKLDTNCSDNVKINSVVLDGDCAVINFSKDFIDGYSGTEKNEINVINCIVNTLTELNEVNCVKILIDGEENYYWGDFNLSEKYYRVNE